MRDVNELLRPNIRNMEAYSSARNDFSGSNELFLDANENPFDLPYNRYPDPLQKRLRNRLAVLKGMPQEQLLLTNGSDEALDLLFRAFCVPRQDQVIICPPTYGMYKVLSDINDVDAIAVPLAEGFQLDVVGVMSKNTSSTKLLFVCNPNNPTGNEVITGQDLKQLTSFSGIVVVDEAYVDFGAASALELIGKMPNLVVLQTLSKAYGMAGLRIGMLFACEAIIKALCCIKPPYNISEASAQAAFRGLLDEAQFQKEMSTILKERARLEQDLSALPFVIKVHPSVTNFILIEVDNADKRYLQLLEAGIVIRNRTTALNCTNCLRITIGTPEQNTKFLDLLKQLKPEKWTP